MENQLVCFKNGVCRGLNSVQAEKTLMKMNPSPRKRLVGNYGLEDVSNIVKPYQLVNKKRSSWTKIHKKAAKWSRLKKDSSSWSRL